MESNIADVKFVADLAAKTVTPTVVTSEKEHFIVVPAGTELKSLKDFQHAEAPARKAGKARALDITSFASYFNRFKNADSLIFADPGKLTFTGILDYHEAGTGEARYCRHLVELELQTTEAWKAWRDGNRKPKAQGEFAGFIEDNLADIFDPPAAVMLDVSRELTARSEVNFSQAIRLQDGQTKFTYTETLQSGVTRGDIEVPESFYIRLAIFLGQPPVEIRCRLRYRLSNGGLTMWYDMYRVGELVLKEFEVAKANVAEATSCQVLLGAA